MDQPTLTIETRLGDEGWKCYTETPLLGRVVISQARTIQRAQLSASKFCDGNFPEYWQKWEGGYEGGNPDDALPQNTYWGDN